MVGELDLVDVVAHVQEVIPRGGLCVTQAPPLAVGERVTKHPLVSATLSPRQRLLLLFFIFLGVSVVSISITMSVEVTDTSFEEGVAESAPETEHPPQSCDALPDSEPDVSDTWETNDPLDEDLNVINSRESGQSLPPAGERTKQPVPAAPAFPVESNDSRPPPPRPPPPRPPPGPPPRADPSTPSSTTALSSTATPVAPTPSGSVLVTQCSVPPNDFVFLSEQKAVPKLLHDWQESSVRHREEFETAVHDLNCRVASLTAALATERLERDKALTTLISLHIYQRTEEAVNSRTLHDPDDSLRPCRRSWMKLEQRLSALDSDMTHSVHVGLENTKRSYLEELRDELDHFVQPAAVLETEKADKRESSLFRRLEDLVGSMARRFQEEQATRFAATAMAGSHMQSLEDFDERKAEQYLEQIASLRVLLEEERAFRLAADERLLGRIQTKERLMKAAMLEVVGDGSADVPRLASS